MALFVEVAAAIGIAVTVYVYWLPGVCVGVANVTPVMPVAATQVDWYAGLVGLDPTCVQAGGGEVGVGVHSGIVTAGGSGTPGGTAGAGGEGLRIDAGKSDPTTTGGVQACCVVPLKVHTSLDSV